MNVCMVGYGMMGVWHTEALKETDCQLYMAVGRREEPLVQFSTKYGYRSWTTDFAAALADNNVDVVILANPSELHAQTALASIAAGKHVLVEIPIAMTLLDAERVVSQPNHAGSSSVWFIPCASGRRWCRCGPASRRERRRSIRCAAGFSSAVCRMSERPAIAEAGPTICFGTTWPTSWILAVGCLIDNLRASRALCPRLTPAPGFRWTVSSPYR